MESKPPPSPKWYELAGISRDIVESQMPYLFTRGKGEVVVKKLNNGLVLITGFGGGQSSNVNFIYRLNSQTKIAELAYFNSFSSLRPAEIPKPTLDKIKFNHYLSLQEGFTMLSAFLGISLQEVRDRFPEAQTCNQISFNRSFANLHPKISISFNIKDEQPPIRYVYDYLIDTDEVGLVYTNDGKGNVWTKWNEKKAES